MKQSQMDGKKLGYIEGWLSAVINIILFGLKFWVGLAAGSVAMIADAWHTLSDTLTSLVVILGFWISGKPKDSKHPFGHGRAELIASVVIGTLLGLVGFNFITDSIHQLQNRQTVLFGTTAIIVFGISVIVKEALARFSIWAGKKTSSQSLIADGWHHRSDSLASLLIIVGAIFSKYFWWIDGVLGLVVSGLIIFAAFQIIREASNMLLGESPDPATVNKIESIIKEYYPEGLGMHHLHMHKYGNHVEISMHLKMPESTTLKTAHEKSIILETRLKEEMGIEATIHFDPDS